MTGEELKATDRVLTLIDEARDGANSISMTTSTRQYFMDCIVKAGNALAANIGAHCLAEFRTRTAVDETAKK